MDDASVHLIERWQGGDQDAASELYRRYAERLIALARSRMSLRLAQKVEAEDLVQSVFHSFFRAAKAGRFAVHASGDLWRLLIGITRNKVCRTAEWHAAGKRDAGREVAAADLDTETPLGLSREPTPDEAAALTDLLDYALRAFRPADRRIIELRLQGYLLEEVAAEVGRCRHTVLRVLDRFKAEVRSADAL